MLWRYSVWTVPAVGGIIMKLEAIALAACLVATSGCANLNSIYRTHSVRTGEIVLSDAKQRAILTNYESVPIMSEYDAATKKTTYSKKLGVLTRYCAEPSPDVFTVLSSSLAAAGNASLTQESREIAVNIASQISESGATIQRTQTIQTLREMMYRLCERYINGALTDESFEAQAARDHRIIVSILAIEQLTNAVRPEPIILKASSSAQAGADYTAINSELSKARDHQKKNSRRFGEKKISASGRGNGAFRSGRRRSGATVCRRRCGGRRAKRRRKRPGSSGESRCASDAGQTFQSRVASRRRK